MKAHSQPLLVSSWVYPHISKHEGVKQGEGLCSYSGSVATIEAAWTPLIVGDLSVPQLRLRDVGQKDLVDGDALSYIMCLPAG